MENKQDAERVHIARLEAVKRHFDVLPRTQKLGSRVCIITGAATGIGRATALLYAKEGAKALYLLDLHSLDELKSLQTQIKVQHPEVQVHLVQADAADEESIKALCERAIKEHGRLDVFFANAGIVNPKALAGPTAISAKDFMKVMHVNVVSCFLALKYGAPAMKMACASKPLSQGSIIFTASVAGTKSGAGSMDYSASKAAVISLAQTGANQCTGSNVRVNAICPGLVESRMTQQLFDRARRKGTTSKIGQLNPLQRYGVAEEIAQVALFLASEDSSYVVGGFNVRFNKKTATPERCPPASRWGAI